jgi:hypothetical protein
MKTKKILFILFGFVFGFFVASAFFLPELKAQFGSSGTFEEADMQPLVPAKYGKLVAVSGIDLYFQGADGSVYIVRPHTDKVLGTQVTVIRRGE